MYLDVYQYVGAYIYIYIYQDIGESLRTGARPCPLAEQFGNLATKARRRARWQQHLHVCILTPSATSLRPGRSRAGRHALKCFSGISCLLSWELRSFSAYCCCQSLNLASHYACIHMYIDVYPYVCAYIHIHLGEPKNRSAALPASRTVCAPSNQSLTESQLAATPSRPGRWCAGLHALKCLSGTS